MLQRMARSRRSRVQPQAETGRHGHPLIPAVLPVGLSHIRSFTVSPTVPILAMHSAALAMLRQDPPA